MTQPRESRYHLTVRVEVNKQIQEGSDEQPYWRNSTNDRLSVEETVDLGSLDFLGVMGVLGHLHDSLRSLHPARAE